MGCELYRIISGVITTKHVVVRPPSLFLLQESEDIYNEEYSRAYEEGVYTEEQVSDLLIKNNILPSDYKDQVKIMMKKIDDFKLEYFKNIHKPSQLERISKNIQDLEYSIIVIQNKLAKLSQITCSGMADMKRALFLLHNTTFGKDGKRYDFRHITLLHLKNYIDGIIMSEEDIRKFVLSNEWRSLWNIREEAPIFSCKAYELTREQRDILFWSRLYDSIMESHEPPEEYVLKDNYALDGWMINNKLEAQKDKQDNSKYGGAQEIYQIARTKEDVESIRRRNSPEIQQKKEILFKGR